MAMIKRLYEEYCECVHPDDEDAQMALFEQLCNGTVVVSVEEAERKIAECKRSPLYIRLRELKEGEHVTRTENYGHFGNIMIDLDADGKVIGIEILDYLDITRGGRAI